MYHIQCWQLLFHFQAKVIEDEKNKAKSAVEEKDKQINEKAAAEKKANDDMAVLKKEKVIYVCIEI